MKTDILFSSPTIRFSRSQKEAVLAWGKDMGGKDVPTLYGLDKFQGDALDSVGDPTKKVHAFSGNVLYMNSIYQALARVCLSCTVLGHNEHSESDARCIGLCPSCKTATDAPVSGVLGETSPRSMERFKVAPRCSRLSLDTHDTHPGQGLLRK